MATKLSLLNRRFGRLVVVEAAPNDVNSGRTQWRCRCDCGNETVVSTMVLRAGLTTSCGCAQWHTRESFLPDVEYRDVPNLTGYRVGSDGTVWTCKMRTYVRGKGGGARWAIGSHWRRLRPAPTKAGYLIVCLSENGNRLAMGVHRLIASTFLGPCPEGFEVAHNNGKNADNRVSNLRYDTHIGNQADQRAHGTLKIGEHVSSAKLNDDAVREIRSARAHGESGASIARRYGVQTCTVNKIARRESWRHVQ